MTLSLYALTARQAILDDRDPYDALFDLDPELPRHRAALLAHRARRAIAEGRGLKDTRGGKRTPGLGKKLGWQVLVFQSRRGEY